MVRFFEPSLIVRNIRVDRKDVDVLGIIRLKPGQQADIYKVVNENAVNLEALILDGMSIPNGDLYKEVALKGSLEIVSMSLPSSHYVNLADFQTLSPASAGKVLTANSSNEFDWVTPVGADEDAIHRNVANELSPVDEKVVPDAADFLVIEDSADGGAKKKVQVSNLPTAGGGENNTAVNVGSGANVFRDKVGAALNIRGINPASSKVTAVVNGDNVDIDVVEGNLAHQNLSGAGTNTHGQIDTAISSLASHLADTANPHSTSIANIGPGTMAEFNDALSDGYVDDASDPRDPNAHTNSHKHAGDDEISTSTPGANAIPKASAGGTLDAGWIPDGADASALHVDETGEIGGLSEKVTPVGADVLVIEDSADGGSKKKIQIDNLPSAGGGGDGYAYADPPNPTNGEWFQLDSDDFSWYYDAFAAGGSYITNSSGGSTSRPSGESGVSMPIQLNTGSTSSSYHAFSSQGGTVLGSSRFNLKYDVMFKIDANIPSGTVNYRYRIGWMDDIRHGGSIYCGVYLAMARAKNTTNFVGITLDQGSETVTNLGVAFTANTWYRMRISVDADAGNVNFAIAPRGSALPAGSNVTTNIPVATSFPLFRGFECSKVSGTGARTLRLSDWQLYASAA